MKKLIIVGASGFGREVAWLVERINHVKPTWDLVGFIDDNIELQGKTVNKYPVIGTTDDVLKFSDYYFVCAIGSAIVRKKIIEKIKSINSNIPFGTV